MQLQTDIGYQTTYEVDAVDQAGRPIKVRIVNETPLTINLNNTEIVTLMTLGSDPKNLILGYLKNQRLIENIKDIKAVHIDWDRETAFVMASRISLLDLKNKMTRKVVTTGCGEGTIFSCSLDKIYENRLAPFLLKQSQIYNLFKNLQAQSHIYRLAGSVHTCALCREDQVLIFVEDVGRHNAADTIAGKMWTDGVKGKDKIFYTTGRITSEIVIKAALMKIPVLLSRSGVTKMGMDLAQDLNMVIIARAKGKKFIVYNGHEYINFDTHPIFFPRPI